MDKRSTSGTNDKHWKTIRGVVSEKSMRATHSVLFLSSIQRVTHRRCLKLVRWDNLGDTLDGCLDALPVDDQSAPPARGKVAVLVNRPARNAPLVLVKAR